MSVHREATRPSSSTFFALALGLRLFGTVAMLTSGLSAVRISRSTPLPAGSVGLAAMIGYLVWAVGFGVGGGGGGDGRGSGEERAMKRRYHCLCRGLADSHGQGGRDGGVKTAAGLGAVGRLRQSCWPSELPESSVNELLGSERIQSEFQQQTAIEVRNGAKKDVFARRPGVQ